MLFIWRKLDGCVWATVKPNWNKVNKKIKNKKKVREISSLNIRTTHRTMFGKKIELYPTKAASQRTQFPDLTLKKDFISYRRLKTQKYSVSIRFPCSGFSFCEHFNRQLTYAFFFIFQTVKCVSVKRFYINTLLCLPCLGQLLLWKNAKVITQHQKSKENINHPRL